MYYLGIDGGGTKTSFLVVDEKGNEVLSFDTTTSHYLTIGFDKLEALMREEMEYIYQKLNLTKDDFKTCFCSMCGYGDVKSDDPLIEKAIKKGLGLNEVSVKSDTVNALYGALKGKDGINIIAGTGSIAFGMNGSKEKRTGGWHHGFGGDEGAGFWLGSRLILEFTRQSDTRDEKTLLYEMVKEELGLKDDGEIISLVVDKWNLDRTKVASLSKLLYKLALKGDKYALKIYQDAVKEYLDLILPIKKELFDGPCLCSATGGNFKAKEFTFIPLKEELAKYDITLVEPAFSPIVGSAILSLKMAGINLTSEIFDNLSKIK